MYTATSFHQLTINNFPCIGKFVGAGAVSRIAVPLNFQILICNLVYWAVVEKAQMTIVCFLLSWSFRLADSKIF